MLAIPLYPSVAFRLWQVPVCAVALVYMFDVLLAVLVVLLAETVLDIDIELNVDKEVDAEFHVELIMVFVEPDTDARVGLEVIVPPASAEEAGPVEAPTLAVDAGSIDEPIPRLEAALMPEELGTQHSARLEG